MDLKGVCVASNGELKMENGEFSIGTHGAVNGTRTRDPRLGKPMLYQLSYYRKVCAKKMVGL